ncbi:MmpS family transport accessory protein [Nocardia asteroides]
MSDGPRHEPPEPTPHPSQGQPLGGNPPHWQPPAGGPGYSGAGYPPAGYAPGGGYPPPPKKRKVWPWVLGGVLVVILLGFIGCIALVGTAFNEVDKEINRAVTVTYQVEGTGTASSITYSGKNMDIAQDTEVALPWTKDVTVDGFVKTVTLTASAGADGGQITCRIRAGDDVIAEQTASGPWASASCSGDAGDK